MHKWKQIAGLGLLLVALGGIATWDEWKSEQEEKEKETKNLVLSVKPDSVTAMTLRIRQDDPAGEKTADTPSDPAKTLSVTLKLNAGRWEITEPLATLADQQTVTDLIKNVTEYKTESEVADGKDKWGTYGLDNPRRAIELVTSDGKNVSFYVGMNAPVGFSVYTATSENGKVYTGSQYIATSTSKTLFELREKKILSLAPSDISTLKLTNPTEVIAVSKADGKWTIQTPVSVSADNTAMNNLIDDMVGLKAAEFIETPDQKLTGALLDRKKATYIQLSSDKVTTSLLIAEVDGSLYAQIEGIPTVYKLHDDAKGKISKTLRDLRDKKIFNFQASAVTKMTVDGESYTKIENEWYAAKDASKFSQDGKFPGKPEDKPKPISHVRGLVVDLEYAKAEDVFGPESAVMKNLPKAPKHKINLGLESGSEITIDVWMAQDNPEMIYVKQTGSSQIAKTKRSTIAGITPAATVPVGDEASGMAPATSGAAIPEQQK